MTEMFDIDVQNYLTYEILKYNFFFQKLEGIFLSNNKYYTDITENI